MSLAPEWVASHSISNITSEAWTTGGKKLLMKNHRGPTLDKKSIELEDNYVKFGFEP